MARLVCAPGNAGMAAIGPVAGVSLSDADDMLALAEREGVTLTIVGPELPLSVGVVDRFVEAGRPILGPSRAAARIETSKVWAKQFMARHHVPTARFLVAETAEVAFEALSSERLGWPLVIKADGLAAGKGVVLVNTTGEAMAVIDEMLTGSRFGEAGRRIVLEECLVGTRGVVLRPERRPPGDVDWLGAGSQARARRRSRPEHRWDGRLCAKPPADARARSASAARGGASRAGGHA